MLFIKLPQTIASSLPEDEPELLVSHIVVLSQFATRATEAFEQHSDVIMKFLLKHVIMANIPADEVCGTFVSSITCR